MILELDKSLAVPVYTPESARAAGLTETEIERVFGRERLEILPVDLVNPFSYSETRKKCLTTLGELLSILGRLDSIG